MFNFKDLKPEYLLLEQELRMNLPLKYPKMNESQLDEKIQKEILLTARKMYDYSSMLKLANSEKNVENILSKHKSISERTVDFLYYDCISYFLNNSKNIIDVGCGLNPVLVFLEFEQFENYCCIDKDGNLLEILKILNRRFCNNKLQIVKSNFCCYPEDINEYEFDFAFIQKIVPSLYMEDKRQILDNIANLQSSYFLITGSKFSLSRNVSIEEQEKDYIEEFINNYSFEKIQFFSKQNEFGWVVKKYE